VLTKLAWINTSGFKRDYFDLPRLLYQFSGLISIRFDRGVGKFGEPPEVTPFGLSLSRAFARMPRVEARGASLLSCSWRSVFQFGR